MHKKANNPTIEERTKAETKRRVNLSSIKLPEGITKVCVWCMCELTGAQRRWCGTDCFIAADVWANPQQNENVSILLIAQDFKCKTCEFDYSPLVEDLYKLPKTPYGMKEAKDTWKTKPNTRVAKKLKAVCHERYPDKRIEVDHILPISKGGLSLDPKNLQILCFTCHKAKSKIDNSGPRKKKVDK